MVLVRIANTIRFVPVIRFERLSSIMHKATPPCVLFEGICRSTWTDPHRPQRRWRTHQMFDRSIARSHAVSSKLKTLDRQASIAPIASPTQCNDIGLRFWEQHYWFISPQRSRGLTAHCVIARVGPRPAPRAPVARTDPLSYKVVQAEPVQLRRTLSE
jgi:hypothetical protein